MRSGRGRFRLALEHAVGALDEVGDEARLPGAPGGGAGGPAVGLGQRGQQVQRQPVAGGLRHAGDGGGVVEVAPGGGVGQQEMVAHEVDQDRDVVGGEAHPRGDAVDHLDADRGVIAREALADVVQEGADEEEVRPLDGVGQPGRQRGGLEQMTVDREGVVGVALGLVADGRPLGDQAHEQAVLVERLDLVDGRSAEAEQLDQGGARLVGPRVAGRGHAVGQAVQRPLGDGPVQLGRGGRQAQRQRGVVGDRGEGRQGDLAVDLDHVGAEVGRRRGAWRGRVRAAEAALRRRGGIPQAAPAPHVVADPGDLAARRRDGEHERVGVGEPERGRHLVLVLQQELVVLALGQAVQLHPDVGEERRGAVERARSA